MLDKSERLSHAQEITYGNAIRKSMVTLPEGYEPSDIPVATRQLASKFVLANKGLAAKEARKFSRTEEDFDDLYQEGLFGLHIAVLKFNPGLGYRFSTYAMWWVKQRIFRYANRDLITVPVNIGCKARRVHRERRDLSIALQRQVTRQEIIDHLLSIELIEDVSEYEFLLTIDRPIMTLDKPMGECDISMIDMIQAPNVLEPTHNVALDKIIDSLPAEQLKVLELRYGLNGNVPHTKADAAMALGITLKKLKSHDRKAMRTFRSPGNLAILQCSA